MLCRVTLCIAPVLTEMGLGARFSDRKTHLIEITWDNGAVGRLENHSSPNPAITPAKQNHTGDRLVQNMWSLENDSASNYAITPAKQYDTGQQHVQNTWSLGKNSKAHHAIAPTKKNDTAHQLGQTTWKVSSLTAGAPHSESNMSRSISLMQYGEGHIGALSAWMFHHREYLSGILQLSLASCLSPSIAIVLMLWGVCACYCCVFKRNSPGRDQHFFKKHQLDKDEGSGSDSEPGELGGTPDKLRYNYFRDFVST